MTKEKPEQLISGLIIVSFLLSSFFLLLGVLDRPYRTERMPNEQYMSPSDNCDQLGRFLTPSEMPTNCVRRYQSIRQPIQPIELTK